MIVLSSIAKLPIAERYSAKRSKLQNDKSQFPNSKQMSMTEFQNLKQVWVIDSCNFEFIGYLVIVI
jgi:hypothetical protein